MNIKQLVLAWLMLLSLLMLIPAGAANLPNQTINGIQINIKPAIPANPVIKKTPPANAIHLNTTLACPKLMAKGLRVVRVLPQPARGGVQTYRFILDGSIANRGATGVANAGLNVTQSVQGRPAKRIALKLFKQQVRKKQTLNVSRDLRVTIQSDALSRAQASHTVFKMNVTNLRNERGACGEYNPTVTTLSAAQVSRALPAQVRGVGQQAGVITPARKSPAGTSFGVPVKRPLKTQKNASDLSRPSLPAIKAGRSVPAKVHPLIPTRPASAPVRSVVSPSISSMQVGKHKPRVKPVQGFAPVVDPVGASVSKAAITQGNSELFKTKSSAKPGRAAITPPRILKLDKTLRHKLETAWPRSYTVLTQRGTSTAMKFNRQAWKGNILLPNLARQGQAIHVTPKGKKTGAVGQKAQWLLKNPDGSLSKQIRDVNGRLAGNITLTRDGSVRIGIDLTGDQEADLYEMVSADGEHSLLASPVGQAALDHFLNGGKNPLCDPAATVAGQKGGGFAGGMISASDKTAMQVACGKDENRPGNGGSAAGGNGNVSGDPGGRVTDTMCRDVLSRHRSRPGSPGQVMGNPAPEDREEFSWDRALAAAGRSLFHTAPDVKTDSTGQDIVTILGEIFSGGAATTTNAVGDGLNAGAPRFVNEADRDLKHFEERQDPGDNTHPDPAVVDRACAAGSTSHYCAAWHREHDSEGSGSANNGASNSSDPGPDEQNNPDTALLAMCEARARSQAMRDAMTKDTSYVHQLCANPASQPNPAGKAGSATLGGSYGSSITLATYCGQHGGRGTAAPTPERLAGQASGGRNCGPTESPGADGRCHGVGRQYGLGNGRQVNLTYGAAIGFTPFNPAIDPSPEP